MSGVFALSSLTHAVAWRLIALSVMTLQRQSAEQQTIALSTYHEALVAIEQALASAAGDTVIPLAVYGETYTAQLNDVLQALTQVRQFYMVQRLHRILAQSDLAETFAAARQQAQERPQPAGAGAIGVYDLFA